MATGLQNYAAGFSGIGITITWTLSCVDPDVQFSVERSSASNGSFVELSTGTVTRDGFTFTFIDERWESGASYRYRVEYSSGLERKTLFETGPVATPVMPVTLYQNNPNPFNPSTTIRYYLPDRRSVRLEVLDVSGRIVARPVNGEQERGGYAVEWRGEDERGAAAASGIYFCRLTAGKMTVSRKMVLLR